MQESKIHKPKNTFMKKLIVGTLLLESLILPLSCNKKEEVKVETTQYLNVFSPSSHGKMSCDVNFDIIPFQLTEQFQKVGSSISVRQTKQIELFNSKNGNYYLMPNPYNRKYSAFYLNESLFLLTFSFSNNRAYLYEFKQNNPRMYVLPLWHKNVEKIGVKDNKLYICSDAGTSLNLLDEKGLLSHYMDFKNYEEYMKTHKPPKIKLFK